MTSKQGKHDTFCWDCCRDSTTLECLECVRSFHTRCLPRNHPKNPLLWVCPKCVFVKARLSNCSRRQLDILPVVINKVWRSKKFEPIMYILKGANHSPIGLSGDIVNAVNLRSISRKVDTYNSLQEFLADIQWIHHNCRILFTDDKTETKLAKLLVEYFTDEISNALKCVECYLNADKHPYNWFTMACDEPHLIIWAKTKGAADCPAKFMSAKDDLVMVRFFGSHSQEIVTTKCNLYSKINPSLYNSQLRQTLKEVDLYIDSLEMKFGRCQLPEVEIVFNPANVNQYISKMFPGLVKYRTAQQNGSPHGVEALPNGQCEFDAHLRVKRLMQSSPAIDKCTLQEQNSTDDLQTKLQNFAGAYGKIIASNAELQKQLKDKDTIMESTVKTQNQLIKSLEDYTQILTKQVEDSEKRFKELQILNTVLISQIDGVEYKMKQQHEREIAALKKQHEAELQTLQDNDLKMAMKRNSLIEERDRDHDEAVTQAKERCKRFYLAQIEEAKGKKYCAACDKAKPLDIFFCDIECQKKYFKSHYCN